MDKICGFVPSAASRRRSQKLQANRVATEIHRGNAVAYALADKPKSVDVVDARQPSGGLSNFGKDIGAKTFTRKICASGSLVHSNIPFEL